MDCDFSQAVGRCGFRASTLSLATSTSNQAVGNRLEAFLAQKISARLKGFRIEPCAGQGYPDSRLVRIRDNKAFPLEFKATQGFNSNDNNRMVLMCSTEKLRRDFTPPINPLLATACYQRIGTHLWVRSVRLDYMDPTTPVMIRLEASVSKRLLVSHQGAFSSIIV
jgi:hypothetical protein